ncbi:MAG: hypothetical protein QJR02_01800 [Sinobacteraceae bacterium]|nr:hypothetical protein [Nevskiaceae bacterium]
MAETLTGMELLLRNYLEGSIEPLENSSCRAVHAIVAGDGDAGMQELARIADDYAVRAAELSAYLAMRGVNGCGDSGHNKAVLYAYRRRTQIRKVLGFTVP